MELKLISSTSDIAIFHSLLSEFEQNVYNKAFPDENERELFQDMLHRVGSPATDNQPSTYMVAAIDNNKIVGMEIVDHYSNSKALEIIYLVVDCTIRSKGIGKTLALKGTELIIEHIGEVKNVFLETNSLAFEKSFDDNFNPRSRTRFFRKLGAKIININYIQPPLSKGKLHVDNLVLMVLPHFCVAETKIKKDDLKNFLTDFYIGLGCNTSDTNLKNMFNEIDNIEKGQYVRFGEILCSNYEFPKSKVTLHFSMDKVPESWKTNSWDCTTYYSYQTDLMNYQNQNKQILKTIFHDDFEHYKILMPESFSYSSEGMTYHKICDFDRREIEVDIAICYSYNIDTNSYIAHLSFRPSKGSYFSELDIIKLCTHFGSKQERVNTPSIKIKYEDKVDDFQEFLQNNLCHQARFVSTGHGISQIITEGGTGLFFEPDMLDSFIFGGKTAIGQTTESFLRAMCGIILGIFDYERMNLSEIKDTIRPIVVLDNSFAVLCRGNLFQWAANTDSEIHDFCVISPYLLLPSCVLTFNEQTLNKCDRLYESIQSEKKPEEKIKIVIEIERILNTQYIKRIFQYPSENTIVETGIVQRNLQERYEKLQKDMEIATKSMAKSRRRSLKLMERIQATLLLIVAVTQIIMTIIELSDTKNINLALNDWLIIPISVLLIAIFGIVWYRIEQQDDI